MFTSTKIAKKEHNEIPIRIPKDVQTIWDKYKVGPSLRKHMMLVADQINEAYFILTKKRIEIDRSTLIKAALLHDIGKVVDEVLHPFYGRDILIKEGMSEIANIIVTHGYAYELEPKEEHLPKTIEQKLLTYADLHAGLEIYTYSTRVMRWNSKGKDKKQLSTSQVMSALARWNQIVFELNNLLGREEQLVLQL